MWMEREYPSPSPTHTHTQPLHTSLYKQQISQLSQLRQQDVWRTEPALFSARLSVTTYTQICVRITLCDALRVPAPPSAKLNLSSPFFLRSQSGAYFQAAPILCANTAWSRERSKPPLPKAQCNCPVIVHSFTALKVGGGGGGWKSCEHSTSKIL